MENVNPYWTQVGYFSEPDLVCHRIFPFSSTTCWPRDVCPWSGRRFNLEDTFTLSTHLCMKMQTVIVLGVLLVVLHINVGDAMPCSRLKCSGASRPGDTCVHIPTGGLRCVSWNTRGLLGSTAASQISREQKHEYLTRLSEKKKKTTSCVSRKRMGKTTSYKLLLSY